MKMYFMSIVTFGFMGYLWLLFTLTTIDLVNTTTYPLLWGLIVFIPATLLFFHILNEVKSISELKFFHPLRLSSYGAFVCAVLISALFY